jgi:hypothetical protein
MDNINIQDLSLLAASRHSISGKPILQVIHRKLPIFVKFILF